MNGTVAWVGVASRRLAFTLALAFASCAGSRVVVRQPALTVHPAPPVFRAGAAEVELTPPPGLPIAGWSRFAGAPASGVRLPLFARALALADVDGGRLAIVAVDLWSVSGLLQREVARQTAAVGIGPDRLMLAATHTHSGPAGFSGVRDYDDFAAGQPGFDPDLVRWLADRIARAVVQAFERLEPACLTLGETVIEGLSRNRSLEAWQRNFPDGGAPGVEQSVDRRLRLIRAVRGSDASSIAEFGFFAVHPTALGPAPGVWHGDVFGVAVRSLTRFGTITSLLNGAVGDVGPAVTSTGIAETERIGLGLAAGVRAASSESGMCVSDVRLAHAYFEVQPAGAATATGAVCDSAVPGLPMMAGSEEGRSWYYGFLGFEEGSRRREPGGCQGVKRELPLGLGSLLFGRGSSRRSIPFQAFRLGDLATLVAVPGEFTTMLGAQVTAAVAEAGVPGPILVGLANDYLSYWTTRAEYDAQHYEGGSTLFGPNQGQFAIEQARVLGQMLASGGSVEYPAEREYHTGKLRPRMPRDLPCDDRQWRALQTAVLEGRVSGERMRVWLDWRGSSPRQACDAFPRVLVACGGAGSAERLFALSRGLDLEIRHRGGDRWRATWFVPPGTHAGGECRMQIERPGGGVLFSEPFLLP